MRDTGYGMVLDDKKLVGVFTERDVLEMVNRGTDFAQGVDLRNVMTTNPITVDKSESAKDVMRIMQEKNIRHLPVMDGEAVVGIVSIKDLMGAILQFMQGGPSPE